MSAKIYLCNKIERLPVFSAQLDDNGNIIPKTGKSWLIINEAKGEFSEENKDTNGGLIWVQKLDFTCELTNSECNEIANASHVYRISFSNGGGGILGSLDNPVLGPKILGSVIQKQVSIIRNALASEF